MTAHTVVCNAFDPWTMARWPSMPPDLTSKVTQVGLSTCYLQNELSKHPHQRLHWCWQTSTRRLSPSPNTLPMKKFYCNAVVKIWQLPPDKRQSVRQSLAQSRSCGGLYLFLLHCLITSWWILIHIRWKAGNCKETLCLYVQAPKMIWHHWVEQQRTVPGLLVKQRIHHWFETFESATTVLSIRHIPEWARYLQEFQLSMRSGSDSFQGSIIRQVGVYIPWWLDCSWPRHCLPKMLCIARKSELYEPCIFMCKNLCRVVFGVFLSSASIFVLCRIHIPRSLGSTPGENCLSRAESKSERLGESRKTDSLKQHPLQLTFFYAK